MSEGQLGGPQPWSADGPGGQRRLTGDHGTGGECWEAVHKGPSGFQTRASHPGAISLRVLKKCPRLASTCGNSRSVQHCIQREMGKTSVLVSWG